ncbi:unnamed protein product [Rotaria sordida]|uniref:Uncharacterized protein n=1 Tax=Rotaria sordida TaxID=392033 RepID=A0A814UBB9_9BILA|nr:unnamed protein product [Rotaria sordida]CAF3763707.1 unnamed protein product [Rotaria sordida]
MLFKRARELALDIYHGLIQGTVRDIAKCSKIIKAIDDNSIDDLRTILTQLNHKDIEDYLRRPVDSMKRTPLHFAAWAENTDILEILLDYINEPDIEDKTGATPMMFVVGSGNNCLKKMTMLINKHVNVNKKDKSGWTLLHAAVQTKRRDILELLLVNGANIHITDGDNRSLLHIACDNGDISLVKYLLEKGVSLKSKDKNGWTPLHIACGPADDYELVHYLIQKGADPHAYDTNECMPIHLATQFNAKKVVQYLKTLDDLDTDIDNDDSSSDLDIGNDTYESDNVFESEPPSGRVSQKSNVSIEMIELSLPHGLICAWRVVETNDNQYCWVILVGLGFLLVETGIVVWLRNGREFKTVAFCIIFYLTCSVPSLWIIHVETANRKLYRLAENKLNARAAIPSSHIRQRNTLSNSTLFSSDPLRIRRVLPTTTQLILSIGHIECHDKAWYYMEEQRWLDAIQETLLVVLTLSRLLISHEHMTIEKSGIILVVTLINVADLLSISHSLQYHDVIIERVWMYIGLILLTIALFEMAFIDTDGLISSSNENTTYYPGRILSRRINFFQDQNICPLFRSLFIHDGLLLLYRMFLASKVRCSKPSIILFMSKNILMIAFHCYRVYNIAKKHKRKRAFDTYELLISTPIPSRNYHYKSYGYERQNRLNQEHKLLHRTIRRPLSIAHRRITKTQRAFRNFTPESISYPFARRRNDGGRARTAFALYGLPFPTTRIPRPATISSTSSLVAKALVH